MMRIGTAGITILIVIQSAAVHADTFKDAVDAAYCIGVDQGEIDYKPKIQKIKDYAIEELQSKIGQRQILINNDKSGIHRCGYGAKNEKCGLSRIKCVLEKTDECADGLNTFNKGQMAECENSKDALCQPTNVCDEDDSPEAPPFQPFPFGGPAATLESASSSRRACMLGLLNQEHCAIESHARGYRHRDPSRTLMPPSS